MSDNSEIGNALIVKKVAGGTSWSNTDSYVCDLKKTVVFTDEWSNREAYVARHNVLGHKPLDTNMAGRNSNERSLEFNSLRKRKPKLKRVLNHIIISAASFVRDLTDADWKLIGRKFLEYSGYFNCDYLIERHRNTKHQHIHLLISRITRDGRVISDSHDYSRHSAAIEKISDEFNLFQTESIVPEDFQTYSYSETAPIYRAIRRASRRKTVNPLVNIELVKRAVRNSHTQNELSALLTEFNIQVEFSTRGITGPVSGWKLRNIGADEWIKGSSLARDLSWPKVSSIMIKNRLEQGHEAHLSTPRFS